MPQTMLYDDLTQRLPKVLEPRYENLPYENGELIPTQTDLVPGAKEIAYDRFNEFGDADFMSDATTNIPIVDISVDEDRYPIYMIGSGFPTSLQEERAHNNRLEKTVMIDRMEKRMSAARAVIAQRTNRFTALGAPGLRFPAFLGNPLVPTVNTDFNPYDSNTGFDQLYDFFVDTVESITDNFVSLEPTVMLIPTTLRRQMLSTYNQNGTITVLDAIEKLYPQLEIRKVKELSAAILDAAVTAGTMTRPGAGKDRIMLYPKEPTIMHRHIEAAVAQLAPPEYIRIDGLRKIYLMFSVFTPAIFDYPQDIRYIDIARKV